MSNLRTLVAKLGLYPRSIPGFHVYEGTTTGEKGKIRQKQVDIMIAVDMLTHSFRRNMDKVTLLTGDLDFKPLIDALVSDGMYVTLWFEEESTNQELLYAADSHMPIRLHNLWNWATQEFRKKYPIPSGVSTSSYEMSGYERIKSGNTEIGQQIELYTSDQDYIIIFPDIANPGYNTYVKHDDKTFLEKYVKEEYVEFSWE